MTEVKKYEQEKRNDLKMRLQYNRKLMNAIYHK